MALVGKVLPPWTPRAGKGGILLPGPAQRFDVRGDPSFSAVWRTYLQMGMGSILQSQISSVYKGTSFTPADRDGNVARSSSGWLEVLFTADHVIDKLNQFPAGI